jgi:hypothetical protein
LIGVVVQRFSYWFGYIPTLLNVGGCATVHAAVIVDIAQPTIAVRRRIGVVAQRCGPILTLLNVFVMDDAHAVLIAIREVAKLRIALLDVWWWWTVVVVIGNIAALGS